MKQKVYEENFTGHHLKYTFLYKNTHRYMYPYIKETESDSCDIRADHDYVEMHRPYYTESTDENYIEYKSLINLTSLKLIPYKSCIIHSAAFLMDEYAWLLMAPSGTGKSTQYFNLKSLYGNKIEMICGDMPVLEMDEDEHITVHPSPWNGKERIKGHKSAPLGGILYLKQGDENRIRQLSSEEAVIPVFSQLAIRPETKEEILIMSALTEAIVKNYPVFEMVNLGDISSSKLAAETLKGYRP